MADKKRRSFFSRLSFTVAATILAVLLVMSYLSVLVNPAKAWFFTIFGLLYVPVLILSLIFLVWAMARRSRAMAPLLLALLPALIFSGRFVQLRKPDWDPSPDAVKMITYNVGLFAHGGEENRDREVLADSLLRYLAGQKADILCLQEFYLRNGQDVRRYLHRYFPGYNIEYYVLTGANGAAGNVTLSRFPVSDHGKISFEHSTNMAIYTDLNVDGYRLRVYNCHFESYNISLSGLVKSLTHSETAVEETSEKMKRSITARPRQVDQVMQDIEACPLKSIVAGDFNDNPLSYTYTRLKRGRKDAFREAGEGFGATYRAFWPLLRIDYILYPDEMRAVRYDVDRARYSDHYPVSVLFEKRVLL